MIKNFLKDENGQGMVEYGLILALISVVVIALLATLGGKLKTNFTKINDELDKAAPAA